MTALRLRAQAILVLLCMALSSPLFARSMPSAEPVTTWYVYNGQDIVAEYEGDWAKPKAITTHGPNTDDPVVRYTRNVANTGYDKRYYHQDGLGSSVAVTNETGTLIATQLFDAWGNKQANASLGQVERYGFTGRESDATGLQGGINQYAYVGNDPVNFTEPSGLVRQSPVGAGASGYAGCVSAVEPDAGTVTDYALNTEGYDLGSGEVKLAGGMCEAIVTGAQKLFNCLKETLKTSPGASIGKAFGGLAAAAVGQVSGDKLLTEAAMEGLAATSAENTDALYLMMSMGRGGKGPTSLY